MRERLTGFRKPIDSGKRKNVKLAVIRLGEGVAECSCGAPFTQPRKKVREAAIENHVNKRHGGRALWL